MKSLRLISAVLCLVGCLAALSLFGLAMFDTHYQQALMWFGASCGFSAEARHELDRAR